MPEENINDIHISEAERIKWIEFDNSSNDIFDVDYIIENYDDFWNFLQIFCVTDCCGLNALRLYQEDIINAIIYIDKEALKQDLEKLKIDLLNSEKEIIRSDRLNCKVDKTVFIKLLDHITKCL